MDLLGPLPSGDHLLVTVDYYSRFIEVDIVRSMTADVIVSRLDNHFCRHGVPVSLRTDNGPPFNSDSFRTYLHTMGIEHIRTTPLWPRANGEVERQNRTIMKVVRAAQVEKRNWKLALNEFLLAYRTTNHSTTGRPPAELLFNRIVRCKLPSLIVEECVSDQSVRDQDAERKQAVKDYADHHNHAADQGIQPGDHVLVRRSERPAKGDSLFLPEPQTVERHGNQVLLQTPDGKQLRRNIHFTKPYLSP